MSPDPRGARPRAFRLDADGGVVSAPSAAHGDAARVHTRVELQPDIYAEQAAVAAPGEAAIELAQRRGMRGRVRLGWGGLFWSALGGLVSIGVALWVDRLIEDLFSRLPALGWLGVALAGLAILSLGALAVREVVGVVRQSQVAKLHADLAAAHGADDRDAARRHVTALSALYRARRASAAGRAEVARGVAEIIDGRDLIDIAERVLILPIDAAVAREIAGAAKRVSLVTAISPRAVLDLVFVVAETVRLIRRVAELYGGRPGLLGFVRLARSIGTHLAVTGTMAIGDSLVQQLVGHGIAAKLSKRLGEGMLNGLLTTRVGLSAMAVCRPMPFVVSPQPGVKDVAPFLFGQPGADP